jgi:hypothetical protein
MKPTKPESPSKTEDRPAARRPRPLVPASWLNEVKPDDDVMAVFYGRSPSSAAAAPEPTADPVALAPAPAPAPVTPVPVVTAPLAQIAPIPEPQPVSRETENRETGLQRETFVSRSLPVPGDRETAIEPIGLPGDRRPGDRNHVNRETDFRSPETSPTGAHEGHWPSRRYKVRVQARIPQSLNDELTAYCTRRGVTRDAAIDRAIRMLLSDDPTVRETVNRETGLPDIGLPVSRETKTAHHDHDHDDHDDHQIMMIFERETGRRFRADERSLVGEFRDVDPTIVTDAIRYAVKYSREPVGSFAYCAKVIRQRLARGAMPGDRGRDDERADTPPPQPTTASLPEDDKLRFEIRTAAARLREVHRDDSSYTHERLVLDVRSGFVVQGREVTREQIEEALRGLSL